MTVKELIKQLKNIDPEIPVKLSGPCWEHGILVGIHHTDIESLCAVSDELWLLDDVSKEWLDSL